MRNALIVCSLLLGGCQAMHSPTASTERRFLVCSGEGAYTTCRRMSAAQYEPTLRGLNRPLTGSRIAHH